MAAGVITKGSVSIVHGSPVPSLGREAQIQLDRRESTFRITAAYLLLLFSHTAVFGVMWDIQWHVDVGRDRFLTIPHLVMYASIALSGLLALVAVCYSTYQYHASAPALNRLTTTQVLKYFHAPLGLIMAGFGQLISALAAPLDDYWHQLYGIDVSLWAPFHVMAMIGNAVGSLGLLMLLASEVNRSKARGELRPNDRLGLWPKASELAMIMGITSVAMLGFIVMLPATRGTEMLLHLGSQPVFVYPVMAGAVLPLTLVMIGELVGYRWAATAVALIIVALRQFYLELVPLAVEMSRVAEGFSYRPYAPVSDLIGRFIPPTIVLSGFVVDLYRQHRHRKARPPSVIALGIVALLPTIVTWTPYLQGRGDVSRKILTSIDLFPTLAVSAAVALILSVLTSRLVQQAGTTLARVTR